MVQMILLAKQKQRHRHREQTYRCQWEKGVVEELEIGADIFILLMRACRHATP